MEASSLPGNIIRSLARPDPVPTTSTPLKKQMLLTNNNYNTQRIKIPRQQTRWKLSGYQREVNASRTSVPSYHQPRDSSSKRCSNKIVRSLLGPTRTCPEYFQESPLTSSMPGNVIRSPARPDPVPIANTPPKKQMLLTNSNYSTRRSDATRRATP